MAVGGGGGGFGVRHLPSQQLWPADLLPLRATDNERYSVSGVVKHVRKQQNSIRLLEAKEKEPKKERKEKKERKKERSFVPTWGSGSEAIVARSGQEPPPAMHGCTQHAYAQPDRYYKSQSNNLQILLLCRMTAI